MLIYSAAGSPCSQVDSGQFIRSRANDIYSPGSDKLTEVQLYMSTSCQPGSQVIRTFSDIEKPLFCSEYAVKASKSETDKGFSTSEKV